MVDVKKPQKRQSTKSAPPTNTTTNLEREPSSERPVRINFDIDRNQWRELKKKAVDQDQSIAEVMRELIDEYLLK